MKTKFPLIALTFIALCATSLRAADEDPARLAALRTVDDERIAATIAADRTRLEAIFSDDLRYAHSTGGVDTKASYVDGLVSGRSKYLSLIYQERNFTFPTPGIALMTGKVQVKHDAKGTISEGTLSFLAVWREEKGQWKFLAWQSCRLPAPAAPKGK